MHGISLSLPTVFYKANAETAATFAKKTILNIQILKIKKTKQPT